MLVFLAMIACRPTDEGPDLGVPVAGPASGNLFLRGLSASSGLAVDTLLDGSSTTVWKPSGDPRDEGVDLWFEGPIAADMLTVEACERTDVRVYLNGAAGPAMRLQAGRSQVAELNDPQARELSWLRLAVEGGSGCLAEVSLREAGELIPLRPPRSVRGHLRATGTNAPTSVFAARWLLDGTSERGWAADGDQRLRITLDEPAELVAIDVAPLGAGAAPVLSLEDAGGEVLLVGGPRYDLPAGARDTLSLHLKDGSLGVGELRLVDAHGPVALIAAEESVGDLAAGTSLVGALDQSWQSVCGDAKRRYKLRADGSLAVHLWEVDPARPVGEAARQEVIDGSWGVLANDGPWTTVAVRGRRWSADGRWDADGSGPRAVDGVFQVAKVDALGKAGLADVFKAWAHDRADRVDCLTVELGAWDDAYDALVAGRALVVRGSQFEDLVWHP